MQQNNNDSYASNGNRTTVMAKSGFTPEPKSGYGSDVVAVLFSIFLIIGGASGRMVLRGTNSSPALVVAGFIFLGLDIYSIIKKRSNLEKAGQERAARNSRRYALEKEVKEDTRTLPAGISVRIVCEKSLAALDLGANLNGRSMTKDIKARTYSSETERVRNILSFNNLDLTVVFDVEPYSSEVVIDLFRNKMEFGITLPDNVMLIPENDG